MGPLRAALRAALEQAHTRVDALFSACDLTTVTGYTAFLRGQSAAIPGLEQALEQAGIARLLPDWPARARGQALEADMRALGAVPPAALPTRLPAGDAALLGAAYVLEGSRLGGAVLLRQVQAASDPRLATATRFLGHGAGSRLWAVFLEHLEASEAARQAPQKVLAGAEAAFAHVEQAARLALAPVEEAGAIA